jgi:hypothetical protein
MALCDTFPAGTRKRAICDGTIDMPLPVINKYRHQWGWEPLTEKPETTFLIQPKPKVIFRAAFPPAGHSRPDTSSALPRVKQPGTRLKEEFSKWDVEECPICAGLAAQMDQWGAAGCREHLDYLVKNISERGKDWFATNYPNADSLLWLAGSTVRAADAVRTLIAGKDRSYKPVKSTVLRDLGVKLMVKRLVTKAITETEAEEAELKKKPRQDEKEEGLRLQGLISVFPSDGKPR